MHLCLPVISRHSTELGGSTSRYEHTHVITMGVTVNVIPSLPTDSIQLTCRLLLSDGVGRNRFNNIILKFQLVAKPSLVNSSTTMW